MESHYNLLAQQVPYSHGYQSAVVTVFARRLSRLTFDVFSFALSTIPSTIGISSHANVNSSLHGITCSPARVNDKSSENVTSTGHDGSVNPEGH